MATILKKLDMLKLGIQEMTPLDFAMTAKNETLDQTQDELMDHAVRKKRTRRKSRKAKTSTVSSSTV